MRICMMVTNGGAEDARVVREAASLREQGHEVDVVGIVKERSDLPFEEAENGVRFHRVYWRANAFTGYLNELKRFWFSMGLAGAIAVLAVMVLVVAFAGGPVLSMLGGEAEFSFNGLFEDFSWATLQPIFLLAILAGIAVLLTVVVLYVLARIVRRLTLAFGADRGVKEEETYYKKKALVSLDKQNRTDGIEPMELSTVDKVPEMLAGIYFEPSAWLELKPANLSIWRHRAKQMAELAITFKPDIVHVHDVVTLPAGVAVKQALNIPLIYEAHEIYDSVNSDQRGVESYFGHLQRKYAPEVDHFITTNDSAAMFYKHSYTELPPALVIKNAVDAPSETPPEYDGRLHEAAGLSRDTKILLFQGGLNPNRGLFRLVQSSALLDEGWAIVLMGKGPLKPELVSLYHELKRSSRGHVAPVVFLPPVDREELLDWSAGGTLGVIPYEDVSLNHWYCTPNKLWEYPVAGVPLLIQPFPELSQVVDTYECGFKLPKTYSPLGIAETVNGLDDEALAEAKENCKRFVAEDNWGVYANMLNELYVDLGQQLAGKNPAIKTPTHADQAATN